MKCFVHPNEEAIAVCKICGKAMCANCSAYSSHSGICPECRKIELEKERSQKLKELNDVNDEMNGYGWSLAGKICLLILTFWSIIGLFYFLIKIFQRKKLQEDLAARKQELTNRISFLTGEIAKLDKALATRGVASI